MPKNTTPPINKLPDTSKLDSLIKQSKDEAIKSGLLPDYDKAQEEAGGRIAGYSGVDAMYSIESPDFYDAYEDYIDRNTLRGGQFDTDFLNTLRAENQSNLEQTGNAFGRLAVNIVPQILSGAAAMIDLPGYFSAEEAANNAIVNWADSIKEQSSEALPIYEENPGGSMQLGDFAWWMTRGEGLVESIAAFAATGMGAGKLASLGGKALARGLAATVMGAKNAKVIGGVAGQLGAATMMNQAEAVMEATQVYKTTYQNSLAKGKSVPQAKEDAAQAAATTMSINRVNILLNLTSAKAFLNPMKATRNLLTAPTLGAKLGKIGLEAGQEAVEESINLVAQKAGEAKGRGEKDYMAKGIAAVNSMEGLEAAFLGAIGGAGQTGITSALQSSKYGPGATLDANGEKISYNENLRQQYQKQQKVIEEFKQNGVKVTDALSNINERMQFEQELFDAANRGDNAKVEELREKLFENTALKAFQSGTTDILEEQLKEEMAKDPNEVGPEYLGNAKKALENLKELEEVYNNFEEYKNADEIFYNRAAKQRLDRQANTTGTLTKNAQVAYAQKVRDISQKYKFAEEYDQIEKEEGVEVKRTKKSKEVPLNYVLSDIDNNQGNSEQNQKTYDKFLKEVKNTPEYEQYEGYQTQEEVLNKLVEQNQEDFTELTSKKYQQEYEVKQQQKELLKTLNAELVNAQTIPDVEKLISQTDNEQFRKLAEAKIDTIKQSNAAAAKRKQVDLTMQQLRSQIKVSTDANYDEIQKAIEDAEISQDKKDQLRIEHSDHLERLKNPTAPPKNPLDQFDQGDGSENNETKDANDQNNKDAETELPDGLPNPKDEASEAAKRTTNAAESLNQNDKTYLIGQDVNGNLVYSYDRTAEGHNRAAFLSRDFNQTAEILSVDREEFTDTLEDNQLVLDPDAMQPGTKLIMTIDTEYEGEKYDPKSNTRETIAWPLRLAELRQIADNRNIPLNQLPEYIAEVPIKVTLESGETVFYVHDNSWYKAENLDNTPEAIAEDRQKNYLIRKSIVEKGTVKSKVEYKSFGRLFKTADGNSLPLTEAMPDDKLIIAVGKDGEYKFSNSKENLLGKKGVIINKEDTQAGRPYAVVKVGPDKFIAIPLERTKLAAEVVNSIVLAVEAHLTGDINNPVVKAIADATGHDITDSVGLANYVNQFTYIFPAKGQSIENLLMQGGANSALPSTTPLLSITKTGIEFGRPGIMMNKYVQQDGTEVQRYGVVISRNFEGSNFGKKLNAQNLTKLTNVLAQMVSNVRIEALQENIPAVIVLNKEGETETLSYLDQIKRSTKSNVISANIGTEDAPKWVYTIQPTILFETKFAGKLQTQKLNANQMPKPAPVAPTATPPSAPPASQPTAPSTDIEAKKTKVISSEIVEKGGRKGQTRIVTQTNSTEDVEGTIVSVTEYEAKVGDTTVSLGGRTMTFKEFKEEFPLDEDYEEIFADSPDLNDDTRITVRKVKRAPSSSRFETVVSIFSPVLGGKMDVTIKQDDAKYDAELAALKQPIDLQAQKADMEKGIVLTIPSEGNGNRDEIPLSEVLKNQDTEYYNLENNISAIIADRIVYLIDKNYPDRNGNYVVDKIYKNSKNEFSRVNKPNLEIVTKALNQNLEERYSRLDQAVKVLKIKYDAELAALGQPVATQPTVPTSTPVADTVTENAEQIISQMLESVAPESIIKTIEGYIQNLGDGTFLKTEADAVANGFDSKQNAVDSFNKALELYKARSTQNTGSITLPNGLTIKVDGNTKDSTDISENTFDDALATIEPDQVETIVAEARELLLEGVSPRTQESLQSYIAADIMKRALALKEVGGKKTLETLPVFEEHKESLKQLADFYRKNGFPKKAAVLDKIVDQFPKLQSLVNQYMSVLSTGRVDESMDLDENEEAVGLEKTIYSDDWAFTINSKATASADLRKFFAFVEARDANGAVMTNELGFPEIIPFDQVYDTLHMLLANKPADLDIMLDTLGLYTEAFPWLQTVIDNIENSPERIKNEFVSDMAKHHIGMKFIMWSKDQYGNYSLQRWSSNSSAMEERLRDYWGSNLLKPGSNLILVNEAGDYMYNKEVVDDIVTIASEWEKNPKDVTNEELAKWLGNFGIVLSDATYKDLRAGKYNNAGRKSWEALFNTSSGLVKVLTEELKAIANNPDKIADKTLLKDSAIKALSKLEAINTASNFSNSFRAGTKTIYSYGNNNYLVNRMRDLTSYDSDNKKFINQDLIDKLQKISFTRDSLWLAALTQDGETGELMRSSLGVDYLSLEALKRQYTKSQEDRKLNKLTVDEHELVKLGMFFNGSKQVADGKTYRKVSYFYPTMSDKTTMLVVNALAQTITTTPGGVTDASLESLYQATVQPEINRIRAAVLAGKSDIAGYEPEYFYFLPGLNDLMVEVNGTMQNYRDLVRSGNDAVVNPEVKQTIYDYLQETLNNLVDKKVEDWNNLSIGQTVKDSKGRITDKYTFLDATYMSNVAKGLGEDAKVRYAATDYVFNSLIANSEMMKLFTGDPALYAKFKDGNTSLENLSATFINMGKRLAGDIAPGLELADSANNQYVQVFLQDKKLKSNNLKDSVQKEFFEKINKNYSDGKKGYGEIEGSDAQEYTTWKEHLYVLNQLGRLTQFQYDTINKKLTQQSAGVINNNTKLTYEELGLVMQPMKPVYVGNMTSVEDNADRRVYIKSSSFPLLPQFTAGLQIDKIRQGLEKYEESISEEITSGGQPKFIRASFGTANKVGAVTSEIATFDDNGNVVDNFEVKPENTLILDRSNFRIQQDVPYSREKDEINVGTQERALLFVDLLDVQVTKDKTGKDLVKEYNSAYQDLFEYNQKKLAKRLGLYEEITQDNVLEQFNEVETDPEMVGKIAEQMDTISKIKSPIKKQTALQEFEDEIGADNLERINFINQNFDKIVEGLVDSKINYFFDENDQFKNCD
jgi:hypothetical protein